KESLHAAKESHSERPWTNVAQIMGNPYFREKSVRAQKNADARQSQRGKATGMVESVRTG
ncbi:MAG: hypothetical protein WA869_08465, partial [Alloacidobacterium sp.]